MPLLAKPLTNSAIKKALPNNGKEQTLTDASMNRLICRVRETRSGKVTKTFCYRYPHPFSGKLTKKTIGKYPETTLEEARSKAAELFTLDGNNMLFPSNNCEQFTFNAITLNEAFDRWLKKSNGNINHKKKVSQRFERHVSKSLGNFSVQEITAPMVAHVLDILVDAGIKETCKRVLGDLISTFDSLVNNGTLPYNCLASLKRNYRSPKKQSFKAIEESGIHELIKAIMNSNSRIETKCLMLFQLHTMVRPSEAATAKICDIDFEKRLWTFKNHKNVDSEEHRVPLSDEVLRIVEFMINLNGDSKYLFPSICSNKSAHMSSQNCNSVLKKCGYQDKQHAHGFRALASSIMNEYGMDGDLIEKSLSHTERNEVRKAYNRADYLQKRRELHQWWSNYLEAKAKDYNLDYLLNL
ncbi:tyrosine-type recombinase/integrase [Vibrio parahaemolyticus]|nr:tyrosine-type recombinase/integrase [Vibrio parahaemolyticus]EJC7056103.1 tyrosine-type recombinase/integrase [Vibrio parahaemolyticus]EJC7099513.1 tyrosine-type recombinase/integrase [Vibrio parahaemolyticus]EJC7113263.1 tyrosine-type recombinase/integrase [Vibrio parahaemolyticus]EJC7132290.1 tyrosine-type recombinase/integrase [Vibrio parahaemolyticus]